MKLKLFALHPQSGCFFVLLALLAQLTKVNNENPRQNTDCRILPGKYRLLKVLFRFYDLNATCRQSHHEGFIPGRLSLSAFQFTSEEEQRYSSQCQYTKTCHLLRNSGLLTCAGNAHEGDRACLIRIPGGTFSRVNKR